MNIGVFAFSLGKICRLDSCHRLTLNTVTFINYKYRFEVLALANNDRVLGKTEYF